jgi:RNA polymerase-binding protein DksA
MSGLSEKQLQYFEQRLKQRREALRDIISSEMLKARQQNFTELAGMVHDAGDESFAELLQGVTLAASAREMEEARDIESALGRIRTHAYGVCEACGDAITYERLDAYPTARRCMNCQTHHENRRGGRDVTPSL